jgi:hypothetical protein
MSPDKKLDKERLRYQIGKRFGGRGAYARLAAEVRSNETKIGKLIQGNFNPNDPELPGFAEALGIPLSALSGYAKRPALDDGQVQRLTTLRERRIATGTSRHKVSSAAQKRLRGFARQHQETESVESEAEGELLGVVQVSDGFTMNDHERKRHAQLVANGRKGGIARGKALASKALARHIIDPDAVERAISNHNGNGNRNGNGTVPARSYNKLRHADRSVRQAVRNMVMNMNIAAMQGHREIPVPTEMLCLVMRDYLERLGIKATMLVDPAFVDHIDHP